MGTSFFVPIFLSFLYYKIKQGSQSRRLAFNPLSQVKALVLLEQILQIEKGLKEKFLREQTKKKYGNIDL